MRMFCTYCWKSLLNARKDIARRQERRAKRVRLFCDMRESELNRLTCPACGHCFESLFDVGGVGVTVADPDMADAIRALDADGQAIVLLHYFAEWPDGRIGTHLGIPGPRSSSAGTPPCGSCGTCWKEVRAMTYETVVAATHGDPVAAEEVLEHFDSAIDGLCTHAFVDEGGHTEYGVDTQMKTEMQGRLLTAMLHFKP